VRSKIEKLARSQAPIYITGESGSGKELAARLIHGKGSRREKAFVPVNCGAIPENLMESEFFGSRRCLHGCRRRRDGFFQAASTGTLFLDEVADLPLAMQVKLLRAIQEKTVRKVGATSRTRSTCASSALRTRIWLPVSSRGNFGRICTNRLAVIELKMPPLRECREDIPVLADAILRRLSGPDGKRSMRLSEGAKKALAGLRFSRNTRELENILERAIALAALEEIQPDDLQLAPPTSVAREPGASNANGPLPEYLDRIEREAILEALEKTRFQPHRRSQALGHHVQGVALPHGTLGNPVGGARSPRRGRGARRALQVPSPNCDERPADEAVRLLVVHNISLPPGQFGGEAIVRLFTGTLDLAAHPYYETLRDLKVSAHFLVRREGD